MSDHHHILNTTRQIQQLVAERLGLDIEMGRAIRLETILEKLTTDRVAILSQLQSEPETGDTWQQLIFELTIGETYFFRNRSQFKLLREHVLPELLDRLQSTQHLYVWCAGCATGEEAYSLAILLREAIPDFHNWQLTIIGTDINARAIDAAERGLYRQWSFRHRDTDIQKRYFRPAEGNYHIHDDIRNMVQFRQANLIRMQARPWAHIIMCRNVMLYFREQAKKQTEKTLLGSLHEGGWLLLGHAEALLDEEQQMQTHIFSGAIAYQKRPVIQPEPVAVPAVSSRAPTTGALRVTGTFAAAQLDDNDKPTTDHSIYHDAVQAYQDEAHDRAERMLADLLIYQPDNINARVMLAAVFANRGANTEAHAHLNTALRKDPLNANAQYLRAMLYLDVEQTEQAEQALRAALYSQPGHPLAAFSLGNLLIKD
ncbi:MAG: CheR family methyltransferase [Chloroflexota bacterium]